MIELRLEVAARKGAVSQEVFDAACVLYRDHVSSMLKKFGGVRGCIELSGFKDRLVISSSFKSDEKVDEVRDEWEKLWDGACAGSGAGVLACVSGGC